MFIELNPETSTSGGSTPTETYGSAPAEIQTGANPSCTRWHVIVSGDGCWAIANNAEISLDDFYAWNPTAGTDCSALWLGYAVCVGV